MRLVSGGVDTAVGGLVVVLVLASVLSGTVGAAPTASATPVGPGAGQSAVTMPVDGATQQEPTGPALAQSDIDPDVVVMRVDVAEDGDATWQVEYRVRLDDDNTTAAFNSVRDDIERNASAYTAEFATGMERTVRTAANRTDREMALRNVTVTATNETLPQLYGVITYRFTWTNFATTDGNQLRVGDALAGLFLDAESSLTVSWPERFESTTVTPDPAETRSNAVVWRGPTEFGPDEPSVVAERGGGLPMMAIAAAAGLVVLGLVGVVALRRRQQGERASGEPADESTAGVAGASSGAAGAAGASAADTTTDAVGDETAGSEGEDGGEDEGDEPPEELLSNEEKVLRLLDREGGRIKQQEIASEYDWTDAKTSQVVGKLRDDDRVETFRIGRENVVTLPEESDL